MIKESLAIKNVGPLKDIHIPVLKPLTVLVGDSASGKSTLMKLIVLMRYIFKKTNIRAYLKNSKIDEKTFYIRFNDYLKDGMKNLFIKDSEIVYTVEVNGHPYEVAYRNGKLTVPPSILNEDLIFTKEVWVSEMRNVIPVWASKGTLVNGSSLGFYFDETFGEFEEATDVVKDIELPYLDMKLEVVKGGNNQKKYLITPNDRRYAPFDLKYASSGTLSTAPLVTLMKYFSSDFSFKEAMRRSIISLLFDKNLTEKYRPGVELNDLRKSVHMHVEEPELSLDPYSQRMLVNTMMHYLFHEKEAWDIGMVMATHSPYIVNHLNVLLRASYSGEGKSRLPYVTPQNLAAYKIYKGRLINIIVTDEDSNQAVVDSMYLSETMEDIYNDYEALA